MPNLSAASPGRDREAPDSKGPMFKITKSLRLLAVTLLVATAALALPSVASASSTQLTLLQDDRELLGLTGEDPAGAMAEIRALGVDIIRTNVIYGKIYRRPNDRRKPRGFRTSDPSSSLYDWALTDRLINLAKANGMRVLVTITGPGPVFSSSQPSRCRGRGPCIWKPKPSEFGGFAAAVARRYRGKVDYYSIYNEPNLGKIWLAPRFARSRGVRYDYAAALYRKLWIAAYKAVARYDRGHRNRVLFGEAPAISQPLPFLRAALCLNSRNRPFTGRLRRLQGCSGRVSKLNLGGYAIHPYNQGAGGKAGPQQRSRTRTSLPIAYMPRLHRVMDAAARYRRTPGGRRIYVTEFGFQSNPPDTITGVSLSQQAQFINESDRLLYSDRRVAAVGQYELTDVPEEDQFNTGLRFVGGSQKPAYAAFRLPIVVTRRSANSVEVYGQVRPARILAGGPRTQVAVQVSLGGGPYTTVAQPSTNSRGIFRINLNRSGAASARWRLSWQNPGTGAFYTSRVAVPRKRLRYFKG
jgi:hypothetical protein